MYSFSTKLPTIRQNKLTEKTCGKVSATLSASKLAQFGAIYYSFYCIKLFNSCYWNFSLFLTSRNVENSISIHFGFTSRFYHFCKVPIGLVK